jgi:hypothetical protein
LKRIRDSRQEHDIIEFLDVDVLPEPRIDIFCLSNVLDIPLPQEEIESEKQSLRRSAGIGTCCRPARSRSFPCIAAFFSPFSFPNLSTVFAPEESSPARLGAVCQTR